MGRLAFGLFEKPEVVFIETLDLLVCLIVVEVVEIRAKDVSCHLASRLGSYFANLIIINH